MDAKLVTLKRAFPASVVGIYFSNKYDTNNS